MRLKYLKLPILSEKRCDTSGFSIDYENIKSRPTAVRIEPVIGNKTLTDSKDSISVTGQFDHLNASK